MHKFIVKKSYANVTNESYRLPVSEVTDSHSPFAEMHVGIMSLVVTMSVALSVNKRQSLSVKQSI